MVSTNFAIVPPMPTLPSDAAYNDNNENNDMEDDIKSNSKSCSHLKYLYILTCSSSHLPLARFAKGNIFLFVHSAGHRHRRAMTPSLLRPLQCQSHPLSSLDPLMAAATMTARERCQPLCYPPGDGLAPPHARAALVQPSPLPLPPRVGNPAILQRGLQSLTRMPRAPAIIPLPIIIVVIIYSPPQPLRPPL